MFTALFTAFGTYLIKFLAFICIAVVGFICGKKLKDKKMAQKSE